MDVALYSRTITPMFIVLLNYYGLLYCRTITTGVCVVLHYHRCCVVLLNYYHSCRDVVGAALFSFSGHPPPSRTGFPPLTLLVTVNQSINQSINRFCLSIHPSIHVCIVTLVPHNRVYCFVEILPWMLHCTLEPLHLCLLYC